MLDTAHFCCYANGFVKVSFVAVQGFATRVSSKGSKNLKNHLKASPQFGLKSHERRFLGQNIAG